MIKTILLLITLTLSVTSSGDINTQTICDKSLMNFCGPYKGKSPDEIKTCIKEKKTKILKQCLTDIKANPIKASSIDFVSTEKDSADSTFPKEFPCLKEMHKYCSKIIFREYTNYPKMLNCLKENVKELNLLCRAYLNI